MMNRYLTRPRRGDRGVAMVELGFSLTLLAIVVVGTVDFARIFYFSMELTAAARAGAQYAAQNTTISGDTTTATLNAIKDAAIAAYSGTTDTKFPLTRSDVTLGESGTTGNTTSEVPKCALADGSGTYADPTGTPKTCSSACPGGTPTKVCYVKITVTKQFSRRSGFPMPGVPNPITISRTAWQRVP